jgi:hypothetical protein
MEAIIIDFVEFLLGELKALPHWANAYGLAYHNKEGKLVLYPSPSNPSPSIYVGPQDIAGTYIYIRELEEEVRGNSGFEDGYGACNYVERITKRLRAVAISSNLSNLPSTLSTRIYTDVFRINLNKYSGYTLDNLRLGFLDSIANFERLIKEETKREDVSGCNVAIGALDFEVSFLYAPKCNNDNIKICL